jgi:hypothetical protein
MAVFVREPLEGVPCFRTPNGSWLSAGIMKRIGRANEKILIGYAFSCRR